MIIIYIILLQLLLLYYYYTTTTSILQLLTIQLLLLLDATSVYFVFLNGSFLSSAFVIYRFVQHCMIDQTAVD